MEGKKQVVLGEPVGDFELMAIDHGSYRLSQYRGQVVVIVFWSAECPVSAEYDAYFNGLLDRHSDARVAVLGIDSNVNHNQGEIAKAIVKRSVRFPVFRDADSSIADRFGALTTPHVYIVDVAGRLAYEGAVDDRTFRQPEATVNYVDQALAALLDGATPSVTQTQPYGCTIVRNH
jgi:peroxiredoxin